MYVCMYVCMYAAMSNFSCMSAIFQTSKPCTGDKPNYKNESHIF
jgi:hypothetical protein